jgi:hypothetical protein
MMLAYRLVKLIETHSDQLAAGLLEKLNRCPKTCEYGEVSAEEFKQRTREVYEHLGEWLLGKTEADIEHRYMEIGRRRRAQGVHLSQLICAIHLTKGHLLEFLNQEAAAKQSIELQGELELLGLLQEFFDLATYYAALGFEERGSARAADTSR